MLRPEASLRAKVSQNPWKEQPRRPKIVRLSQYDQGERSEL
jgi:hypothetical protein